MAPLSEWLQLMLAEIARKRDDLDLARAEEAQRSTETQPATKTQPVSAPVVKEARTARG